MSDNGKLRFVKELPFDSRPGRRNQKYDELVARIGEWAEFWGKPETVHKAAIQASESRPGVKFEGAYRGGKAYIRAVKL